MKFFLIHWVVKNVPISLWLAMVAWWQLTGVSGFLWLKPYVQRLMRRTTVTNHCWPDNDLQDLGWVGNELVVVVYTVMYCRLSWENKVDLYIIVVVSFSFCKTSQKLENVVTLTQSWKETFKILFWTGFPEPQTPSPAFFKLALYSFSFTPDTC